MNGLVFLLMVAVATGAVIYVILRAVQEQQRMERLRAMAGRMGFAFSAQAEPSLWGEVEGFHLFSQGRSRRMHNVMQRQIHDIDVTLFDYKYTTGSGKHSHTHYRTVMLFETARLKLPRFTLRPEGFFHRVANKLGSQDIDFEAHPVFSDDYLLQGPNEARIRRIFDEEALLYYTRHPDLCTEGDGRRLVFYQGGRRVEPEGMESLLQQGLDILDVFMEKEGALVGVPLLEMDVDQVMDELLAVEWLE
jgi:hypothetical protein